MDPETREQEIYLTRPKVSLGILLRSRNQQRSYLLYRLMRILKQKTFHFKLSMMNNYIEQKSCTFCSQHISYVDYKDVQFLRKFMSPHGKILASRKTGVCTKHQRVVARS